MRPEFCRRSPSHFPVLFVGLLLAWGTSFASFPTWTFAQEGDKAAAQPAETQSEATPLQEGEGGTEGEPVSEESFLVWIVKTSGFIGAVILVISLYFVHVVALSFMTFKRNEAAPPALVENVEQCLTKGDIVSAYKFVKADSSFYGAVLQSGITSLPYGLAHASETMDRTGDSNVVEMERQISMLAVIGSLGPMIGLLGTLKGMIASFSVIARSGTQLKAAEVAGGISEALVLTFEGVALSVPAIYFFAFFKNRISAISSHVMTLANDQMLRINAIQRRARPATGGAAEPTHG